MTIGREYLPEMEDQELEQVINKDGSVSSPDLFSAEQAQKLFAEKKEPDPAAATQVVAADTGLAIDLDPNAQPAKAAGEPARESPVSRTAGQPPDKVVTVGGVAKPESEWYAELEAKWNVDLSAVPAETKANMLKGYLATEHDHVWKANNTEKAKTNARERHQVSAERAALEVEKRRLVMQREQLTQREAQLKKLAATEVSDEVLNNKELTLSYAEQRELTKVLDAREALPLVQDELKRVEQQEAQADTDHLIAQIVEFQEMFPGYQTEVPIREAIKRFEAGEHSSADASKVLDIYDIFDYSRKYNYPIELAVQKLAEHGMKVRATEPNTQVQNPGTSTSAQEQLAAAIRLKQAGTRFLDGGGGLPSRPTLTPKKTTGDLMHEASQRAVGGGGNKALAEQGY